jgi:hypothetical protein
LRFGHGRPKIGDHVAVGYEILRRRAHRPGFDGTATGRAWVTMSPLMGLVAYCFHWLFTQGIVGLKKYRAHIGASPGQDGQAAVPRG